MKVNHINYAPTHILNLITATSAIDYETDGVIQNSLRTNLGSDVTLFTIAHRLQTIMDADKIVSAHKCSFAYIHVLTDWM